MSDPAVIGRYRIDGVLGRGAMGVIYRAHDPEIDRPVALKLIRADLLDGEARADYLDRFRREAQAAGRCGHPNIVTIYDFALHDGNPFLAMEFVDGISLAQARERGVAFTQRDAGAVVGQVLDALVAAHAAGIVHRDIKPANIMLVHGGRVKVTDFGISRFESAQVTQDGGVVGTPSYMSPEQCRGEPVDARSDLFSTGAVLYELLAGARPFPGRTMAEVMQRLLNEAPAPLGDAVGPAMVAVVDRALAKQAAARFGSAAEMAAALRAAADAPAGVSDHTVVLGRVEPVRAEPVAATGTGLFGVDVLATLERGLARHVGPIARYLVHSAARGAADAEALCETLAGSIDRAEDRAAFRKEAMGHLRKAAGGVAPAATQGPAPAAVQAVAATAFVLEAGEMERAQVALTHHLGPMARVLVKRAGVAAVSVEDFWARLAGHIEREADRAVFLAKRR